MGVGAGAGFLWGYRGLLAGAAGHVGVSYDFWFPMQLSVDWRPLIGAYTYNYAETAQKGAAFWVNGLAAVTIGVRYLF